METKVFIPASLSDAGREVRLALGSPLQKLSPQAFSRAWCSLCYLFPGLHPDGFDSEGSGWTRATSRFAKEAWRRYDAGEITEEVLYPSDSTWCGLYDRMAEHEPEEEEQRRNFAALSA